MFRSIILAFALILTTPMAGRAATVEPAVPIDRPPPSYPDTAGEAAGHVKIAFTIDAQGHVIEPQIVESAPQGVFDTATLDVLKDWRYQPRRVDGQAVAQPGNVIVLNFVPPPPDAAKTVELLDTHPAYPRTAYDAGQEGDVTVVFDLDENGFAENARVSKSTLPDVFDKSALDTIQNGRFRPMAVDGMPTRAIGLSTTLSYRLADARFYPVVLTHPTLLYPKKAMDAGIQGYCYMDMTIAGNGTVEKVELLSTGPGNVFRESCLDYASAMTFEPPDQDQTGRMVRKHRANIHFKFNGSKPLLRAGQWAKVRYTIGKAGQTKDVEIIAVSGGDVPQREVVDAIRKRVVQPIIENGVAVEKPNQIILISGENR
jgi:TonB family protein